MSVFRRLFCLSFITAMTVSSQAIAAEAPRKIVVEETPKAMNAVRPIKHVAAAKTHSGYPVPRYVSLKYDRVNGRQGPSLQHPALWQYRRRGMPLIVVAEMDIWRKVRDINGDESWVRTQALSGDQNAIMVEDGALLRKPRTTAPIVATVSKNSLFNIVECKSNSWCQVRSESGHKGWVERRALWGAKPL